MKRITAYLLLVLVIISAVAVLSERPEAAETTSGMAVYVGEGCIHCHSQFVRPIVADIDRYGPPTPAPRGEGQTTLIGNRRQGPDLANVALRRTRSWNRHHLINPQAVSPGSRMPAYAHLFEGDGARGNALLDYLETLSLADRSEPTTITSHH